MCVLFGLLDMYRCFFGKECWFFVSKGFCFGI